MYLNSKVFLRILPLICFYVPWMVCTNTYAQNLVVDPGFEGNRRLPNRKENSIMCTRDWISPTVSVSDYYHRNSAWHAGVPRNIFGHQKPLSGKAYAGICIRKNLVEYLETKLSDTLIKDKHYLVEFYWCRAERSFQSVTEMGVMFSNKVRWGLDIHGIREKPDVEILLPDGFRNKRKWNKFSAVYKARGGETHLILGHFNHAGVKRFRGLAHYYIEDVSVTLLLDQPFNSQELLSEIAKPTTLSLEVGQAIVLANLHFATDSSEITPDSFEDLDQLVSYLRLQKKGNILIAGHTDNDGKEVRNQRLSFERAKAVADHLSKKGVDPSRIQAIGNGSSRPIATNDTNEGKAMNRRVELTLLN